MNRFASLALAGLLTILAAGAILPAAIPAAFAQTDESGPEAEKNAETYRHLTLFGDVYEQIRAKYVDKVSDKELMESAIDGMLTSLDPHSSYLSPDQFEDMQVQTRGSFGGLGIEVTMENNVVKVVSPIEGTPAYKAGLEPGDLITHLDGDPVMEMNLSEAVDHMRGEVGTSIRLTVVREGRNEPFDVTITRDIIEIESVKSRVIDEHVGYIRVTTFSGQTTSGVEEAVETIRERVGADALSGYILDLRNNPGGLLDEAVGLTDLFLDGGEIVSTRGRIDGSDQRFNAQAGDILDGAPMVVLINGGSASASEIVAGALKDHRRAVVVGMPSFGKGSVQTILTLSNRGAMRLTTAHYYTPSGRSIQAKGIAPDIEIKPARLEELDVSARRREADLEGALGNPGTNGSGAEGETGADGDQGADGDSQAEGTAEEDRPFDYQLERAVDLIRGVALYAERIEN